MKIWAKLMKGDKLLKSIIHDSALVSNPSNFKKDLQEICYTIDVSTPVSLPTHYKHFEKFNRIKFIPRDFVEEVDFTALILELVVDKK
ncbi:MAG: hypothetical protein J6R34_05350 [Clostridia bacterium]|nr:hypothetical protein [Clostridia bacterium]MBO5777854.1 hypothetical protein [Clostridia bacterium]MBO5982360.1 hypothetical protein [Clostridia bacterium]MBR5173551.1 hypothetical protein [Clostridia bacterium]